MTIRTPYRRDPLDPLVIPPDVVVFYCPVCKEPIDPFEGHGSNLYCCGDCGTWFSIESVGSKEEKK